MSLLATFVPFSLAQIAQMANLRKSIDTENLTVHYNLCRCTFHGAEAGGRFGKHVRYIVSELQ
jgi:hypothetical protein